MIITIARQAGSNGEVVGQLVARRLDVAYLDREILERASQVGDVSLADLQADDERAPSLLERLAAYFGRVTIPAGGEIALQQPPPPIDTDFDSHRHILEGAIRQVAQTDSAVIVGRGAQVILRGRPQVLHVFVYAPEEVRIRRIATLDEVTTDEAAVRMRDTDRQRAGYLRSGYGVDWRDPGLYDLLINTGRIDEEAAADLIVLAARAATTS